LNFEDLLFGVHEQQGGRHPSKGKKVTALKETKKRFEERFRARKNRWFFTKFRF
jgi:hypothetical protein